MQGLQCLPLHTQTGGQIRCMMNGVIEGGGRVMLHRSAFSGGGRVIGECVISL